MTIFYEFEGKLYANITNRCPCSCVFCIRKNGDSVADNDSLWLEHEPSYEEIIKAFDDFDKTGLHELVFCGYGEPMERADVLLEVAKYVKQTTDMKIRINTNGLGNLINNRDDVAKLIAPYVDSVSISLNASNKETYQEICRSKYGEAAFDAMLKFTKDCVDAGIDTTMSVVDFIGEDEIKACGELAKQAGAHYKVRETIREDTEY